MNDKKTSNLESPAATVTCPACGEEYSGELEKCPFCGKRISKDSPQRRKTFFKKPNLRLPKVNFNLPTVVGACLIMTAFTAGIIFNIAANARIPAPVETPEVFVLAEPVIPTPTPTPTINGIKLYAFGRELDADGFTAYVGDKAFSISAEVDPQIPRPYVSWYINDSASLSVSDNGLSCEFKALKPTGKNELTVTCYGAETTIPVYLWER